MPNSREVFQKIISSKTARPLVVFDLDSTLFNVSHRTQRIMHNFATEPEIVLKYPAEAKLLRSIKVSPTDWGMKEALIRAQFQAPESFVHAIKEYWKSHFFSSQHLHEDIPYPGAVEYVNALAQANARVVYLTGRDEKNMRAGTIASLKQWNFPSENLESTLIMKSQKGVLEDEDFKAIKLSNIESEVETVWFFENEPVIINKVRKTSPEIKIVWLDTTHSRKSTAPDDIYVIRKYLRP